MPLGDLRSIDTLRPWRRWWGRSGPAGVKLIAKPRVGRSETTDIGVIGKVARNEACSDGEPSRGKSGARAGPENNGLSCPGPRRYAKLGAAVSGLVTGGRATVCFVSILFHEQEHYRCSLGAVGNGDSEFLPGHARERGGRGDVCNAHLR